MEFISGLSSSHNSTEGNTQLVAMSPFSNANNMNWPLDASTTSEDGDSPSQEMRPTGLPPKSPSSNLGKNILSTTPHAVAPSIGTSRRRRRHSKERRRSNDDQSTTSEPRGDQSLADPSPDHLNMGPASDDLSNVADFSMVSFEKTPSPTSVADPFRNIDRNKRSHRKAHSWDSSDSYQHPGSKTCLQVPKVFRRQKVMCADVASVSNASDTVVSVEKGRITGRELHENAKALLNAGDYDQAVGMFEALQKAQIERFGEEHSSVGAAMHNVGVVRLRMGQHDTAEQILCRAVFIRRKVLGNDHLDLAASLTKLGSTRVVLRQFDDALQDLRDALRITRRTLGRCHKTVAQILCQIACLYFEAGEMFSAQATFEDALEIFRDVFPSEADRDACMTQMTETLCNIGSIRNKQKNFAGAIECFREALDLQRGIMGHDDPKVIATLDNLGYSFAKNKSYNQALTCYKEMLNAQVSRNGSFTRECCETLKKQTLIYDKLKKLDSAIKATKKVLHSLNRSGSDDPIVSEVSALLFELKEKRRKRCAS